MICDRATFATGAHLYVYYLKKGVVSFRLKYPDTDIENTDPQRHVHTYSIVMGCFSHCRKVAFNHFHGCNCGDYSKTKL